jgi:predicted DsbA family dithiol-disulfide isomerase
VRLRLKLLQRVLVGHDHLATIGLPRRPPAHAMRRAPRMSAAQRAIGSMIVRVPSGGAPVHVEIWSDIACPWCYVGKRRFEAALAAYEHREEVRVTWRSFELDPYAPREREQDGATHLAEKYGTSREEAQAMQRRMTEIAARDGLSFRFDIALGGNTFDAHRLLHLAAAHGSQDALKERLMRAYLSEGELIGDRVTLQRLGVEVGLAQDEVRDTLATDRFAAEVREDERTAASLGIHAVPFFVVDRAMGASGAQPPEALVEVLRRARVANPPITVAAGGETCGLDGSGC